ncbi:hypothetical protein [Ruegeria sp. ANG-R]|uniref:hypothetical protein n=1 Tax=Ruegeria sp. ANG-R TaxID=1577903 RepID=UPI000690E777|nr:hypothetical protein [Ruegeria sp. ANG-R]
MVMPEVAIIFVSGRRRRWFAADNLRILEETLYEDESTSALTVRNGVMRNPLYRRRKLILERGRIAAAEDDSVAPSLVSEIMIA